MKNNLFDLTDRVAILTGSAGSLGKAIAIGMAKFGASLVLVDINLAKVKALEKQVKKITGQCLSINCDLNDTGSSNFIVSETLKKFNKIDILVNCSGITRRALAENMTEKQWDEVININLKAVFLLCQSVGRVMIKQRYGKIINMASVVSQISFPTGIANYSASKGGLVAFSRTLAIEWAKYGVYVNCISPSQFRSPIIEDLLKDKLIKDKLLGRIPLGRIGEPDELVGPVIFLASDASSMITGINLFVDGGVTAS